MFLASPKNMNLSKDFSRVPSRIPTQDPMSILGMSVLSNIHGSSPGFLARTHGAPATKQATAPLQEVRSAVLLRSLDYHRLI